MSGSGTSKNYKIIVDSKHFGNMKGFSPAEVAKRAAGKILGLSNKINRFSLVETKNGKIRNYKVSKENLIRPYKKNGKLINYPSYGMALTACGWPLPALAGVGLCH